MEIRISRVYGDVPEGYRVLADRLWPRGVSKADVDRWCKDIAPSNELRVWYGHDPERYEEFAARYRAELDASSALDLLADSPQPLVLLTATKDLGLSHLRVLQEVLSGGL